MTAFGIILIFFDLLIYISQLIVSKIVGEVMRRHSGCTAHETQEPGLGRRAKGSHAQQVRVKETTTHLSSRFSLGIRTLSNLRIPVSTPCRPRESRWETEL